MKKIFRLLGLLIFSFVLVGCTNKNTYKLPDLTGQSKQQIIETFNEINKDIRLHFEYDYSLSPKGDMFVKYNGEIEVGDSFPFTRVIAITLSHEELYPDLTNKTQEEVQTIFNNLNNEYSGANLTLEFVYQYDAGQELDTVLGYKEDKLNKPILNNDVVEVLLSKYELMPNLDGKNKEEITAVFNSLEQQYDISIELNFEYVFDALVDEGLFSSYKSLDLEDILNITKPIDVNLGFNTIEVPDFEGFTKIEMQDHFKDLKVPLNKIDFRAIPSPDSDPAKFIRYTTYEPGDIADLSGNKKLIIYLDNRVVLPDLTGFNKHQIDEYLTNMLITRVEYEYTIDDDYEYDSFSHYGDDRNVGDIIFTNEDVVIYIYMNTDVNNNEWLVNEYELFISKYFNSSDVVGIELYNATDEEINLSDYYIAILLGGSFVPDKTVNLKGTLQPNETFVILNNKSTEVFLNKADLISENMYFSGSDTIQLRRSRNDTYTDTIYEVGNISSLMDNEIFVRRSHITHGSRDFAIADWMGFVPYYDALVGIHPYTPAANPTFELITDKTFQEYGMTKVAYIRAADGDTVYFRSIDPNDDHSYDGDHRIRFLLINTPETEKPGQVGEPYAQAAKLFTETMLKGASEIYIQSSKEAGIRDTYGRHLGLIWANVGTVGNPDWRLLNYELLKAGLGRIMIAKTGNYFDHPIFGGRYLYQWAEDAVEYAKENRLGLFSGIDLP